MSADTTDAAPGTHLHLVEAPKGKMTKRRFRRAAKRVAKRATTSPAAGVAAFVAEQTAAAETLAQIPGQERLADPATNPAVRAHRDRLRDDEQRQDLTARHRRMSRSIRVRDRYAADAEKALEVIYAARRMNSPAEAVLALHKGRRTFLGLAQAASLTLSVGSATGPAELAVRYGTHAFVGYIAEIGLTGLSTMAVMYRAHIGTHGGHRAADWRTRLIWLLMIGPLSASIVANAVTHGAVGVFCSIGAALFSVLAYVIGDLSSEALARRAAEVTGTDEAALRSVATGDPVTASPVTEAAVTPPAPVTSSAQDAAEADQPERPVIRVERATPPTRKAPEVTETKRPQLTAGNPRAKVLENLAPIHPDVLVKVMNHPKWEDAVEKYTTSLQPEKGPALTGRRLAEEIGMANRNLANLVIRYVDLQRIGGQS